MLTGGQGRLHGNEPRVAPHELDNANALVAAGCLHLGSQQGALCLLDRAVKAKALVNL